MKYVVYSQSISKEDLLKDPWLRGCTCHSIVTSSKQAQTDLDTYVMEYVNSQPKQEHCKWVVTKEGNICIVSKHEQSLGYFTTSTMINNIRFFTVMEMDDVDHRNPVPTSSSGAQINTSSFNRIPNYGLLMQELAKRFESRRKVIE